MDLEFQKRVRENYLALQGYQGYKIIPTEHMKPEEIFNKYEKYLYYTLIEKLDKNHV